MTEAARQQECINTLKTFNNTIVTIRLYPANAPQIANAIERGYKAVKQHLRHYGNFTLGLRGSDPELCGDILDGQIIQSISNLIVFRQLALLQTDLFVIAPGLDRAHFKRILEIFSAKVEQIKQEGGGWAFVSRLGLDRFFTETKTDEDEAHEAEAASGQVRLTAEPQVRKEFVDVLLGREPRAGIINELKLQFAVPALAAPILVAALQGVLDGMLQKKLFIASSALEQVVDNCGRLAPAGQAKGIAAEAAALLLKKTDALSVVLLLSQNLQSEAGSALIDSLEQQISIDLLGEVIRELRRISAQLRLTQSSDSQQLQFISKSMERLLATPKGKQFLGQEKAKSIIEAGEKTRRARRVAAGVKSLLKGNDDVLQSDEFNRHLPFVLQKMAADGLDREVKVLLTILAAQFHQGDNTTRERIIGSLAQISEDLVKGQRWEQLKIIADPLLSWLKHSDNGDIVYEKVCLGLQSLMPHLWQTEEYEVGDNILSVFYQIRSGKVRRSGSVRAIIERTQDKGLDRALMANLLRQSLAAPGDEVVSRRLILQGPIASRFLVESLIRAEDPQGRIKIIDLLTYAEQFLTPILIEKLAEPMPWYGKRNLLKLLANTGSEEHLDIVYPFLQHDDLRVQREAFNCLYNISDSKRKEALLHALAETSETMKLQVVRALIPFGDAEVARGLSQLLEEHRFYSDEFRDTLLSTVCMAIARCPYPDSEKALRKFLELKGKRPARKIGAQVWQAAEDALNQVGEGQHGERQLKVKAGRLRSSALSKVGWGSKGSKGPAERKSITGLADEKKIHELLELDAKDEVRRRLLDLIARVARLRRFSQAEQLREWLIEIDSQALTDIIRAAEIIKEEKHAEVDKNHLGIWADLLDMLNTLEFSTFHHALQHKQYANEEMIVKKGAVQTALFFINSGKVKLFYKDKDQDVLVKTLHRGQVFGSGTFFDASVWTFSAAALGRTDISVLGIDKLQQWKEDFPVLESKLHDFCRQFESVDDLVTTSEQDRRQCERHKVSAMHLSVSMLDDKEQSTGITTKGELCDISRGGASCIMRIPQKENVRLLLGRNLKIMLPIEGAGGRPMTFRGVIVAVRAHYAMENEYSVHVQFSSVLDSAEMEQILQLIKA